MPLPNQPVQPTYATMQWVEERIKKFQMQVGPMKRGPKRRPRQGGGGVGFLAVTTETAAAATYTGSGATFEISTGVSDFYKLSSRTTDGDLEFYVPEDAETFLASNGHKEVSIPADTLCIVYKVGGRNMAFFANWIDYARELEDYSETALQGIYHPAGSDAIKWGGEEC